MNACADRQQMNNILSPLYKLGSMVDTGKLRKTFFFISFDLGSTVYQLHYN